MAISIQNILASTYFYAILVLFLTMYGPRLAPALPSQIKQLFDSQAFRALVMFLVIYLANRDLGLTMSLTIVIIFMVVMNILGTSSIMENFSAENFTAYERPTFADNGIGGPSPIDCKTYDMKQAEFLGAPYYPLNARNNLFDGEPKYSPELSYTIEPSTVVNNMVASSQSQQMSDVLRQNGSVF